MTALDLLKSTVTGNYPSQSKPSDLIYGRVSEHVVEKPLKRFLCRIHSDEADSVAAVEIYN